jgi:hypothetical protein
MDREPPHTADVSPGHVVSSPPAPPSVQNDHFRAPSAGSAGSAPAVHSGGSMCGPSRGVATLRDRWRSPAARARSSGGNRRQ